MNPVLGHRVAGVEGTIDGLIFPVFRYAGEATRQWMYDVSMFIQMMDDWLDYEDDREGERMTPVVVGTWDFDAISTMWWKTVRGIEDLVRASGLRSPHYVRFCAQVLRVHAKRGYGRDDYWSC